MIKMVKKKIPTKKDEEDNFTDKFDEDNERKRAFGLSPHTIDDFEEHLTKMWKWMDHIFKDALRTNILPLEEEDSYVYGWSLHLGPNGKPQYEEFGNAPPNIARDSDTNLQGRDDMIDIFEGEDTLSITIELHGVAEEDIIIEAVGNIVALEVNKEGDRYYKEIELPCEVSPDPVKTSYRNGIFDIELKKSKPMKKDKKR
jgi:HSP20 family protein